MVIFNVNPICIQCSATKEPLGDDGYVLPDPEPSYLTMWGAREGVASPTPPTAHSWDHLYEEATSEEGQSFPQLRAEAPHEAGGPLCEVWGRSETAPPPQAKGEAQEDRPIALNSNGEAHMPHWLKKGLHRVMPTGHKHLKAPTE